MSREKQIEEMAEMLEIIEKAREIYANDITDHTENEYIREGLLDAGYRKQSGNAIELPCKVGDLVHFKGLETPWKVSAIHIYEEGQPQISITSETGKITSTMTANEFYMFCTVLTDAKMKGGAE